MRHRDASRYAYMTIYRYRREGDRKVLRRWMQINTEWEGVEAV